MLARTLYDIESLSQKHNRGLSDRRRNVPKRHADQHHNI